MKIGSMFPRSIAVVSLFLLAGCSSEAQQAAPHKIVQAMAKLSGAKKGFLITHGKPTYHDWNAGAGNIVEPLEGADADSFYVFEQPKNSKALFASDKSRVYMARLYTPREIKGANAESFELITRDGLYAKDANHAYYLGVPIVGADPSTFEVLVRPFSQDKEHAFIGAAPIPGVDRASWRPLREGWTGDPWYRSMREVYFKEQESVYVAGWSRDAGTFYYGRKPVAGIDVATFEVLSDYYAKDQSHVYSRHYYDKLSVIKGGDPATFAVHEDADDILTRGADAHDAKLQFRNGKVFAPD